jgi:hypothetical protein
MMENLHKVEITTPDPGYEPFPVSIMNRSTYEVAEFDPHKGKPATISYSLNKAGCLRIRIVHRKQPTLVIRTLQDWTKQPFGKHELKWDGRDASGNIVDNKPLFVLFQAQDQITNRHHQNHDPRACRDSLVTVERIDISNEGQNFLEILATLQDNARDYKPASGGQIRYFLDYELIKTEKFGNGRAIFQAKLDFSGRSKGKHLVTVNVDDLQDHVASGGLQIEIE